jgi:microcystin degradation protein MlrC
MRVGILALQHESNTFLERPTTLESFRADRILIGEAIRKEFTAAHHEVGGFFEALPDEQIDTVPLFFAKATPSGVITADAADALVGMLLEELGKTPSLDGILVSPHGAAVAEDHRDFDGYWLTKVRETVGRDIPIICTLDLHANVSPAMVAACNATIAYRTNPHLDQRARGIDAARLMARTLRREVRPTQAAEFPPIAINIERQHTVESPCRELYALADELLKRPRVLANSVVLGFPYADVAEMGTSLIFTTDDDPALAKALAVELAQYILARRAEFVGVSISIAQAIETALRSAAPVCLLDMGDNVGGGSPGDGTLIAESLLAKRVRSFVCLFDPDVAAQAVSAGPGARISMSAGGKTDARHGRPLAITGVVRSIHDGKFTDAKPHHGGATSFNMGQTAVIEDDRGLTVMLTSRRVPPFSLAQLTSCGIEPKDYQVIVAKGVHAPVAVYSQVCPTTIRVDTPGITTADMRQLPYRLRRKPLFPFESV